MTRLLLATSSEKKIAELKEIFAGLPVTLVTPAELGLTLDPEETGATFEQNARLKARAFAAASGLPALADDSGLEVDALGGEPGVYSKRYAGPDASDSDRIAFLLRRLERVPEAQRTARFRCVMALATPEEEIGTVDGTCEGRIGLQP
ncbi:MAG TPA: non-canonical purine NTP pyrophosphatase, partial [Chloroflexota bacterium]|nr:non-canonical purine NTP pyrophosphatase [Chloroflexota bacterium]